jgi:hypothetical protein
MRQPEVFRVLETIQVTERLASVSNRVSLVRESLHNFLL